MKQKRGLKILTLLLAAALLLTAFPLQTLHAEQKKSGNGIAGNGTWGIHIDIYSSPFSDYADPSNDLAGDAADYAYSGEGCAWFASARVHQLTGVDCYIRDGYGWYYEQAETFGFATGTKLPTGKALACFGNHVNVIEAVQDDQYLVSEGGFSGGGRYKENDYCVMHIKTADQVTYDSTFGKFYGFVYLTDDAPVFRTDKAVELPTLKAAENGISLSWKEFHLATRYRVYRKENPEDSWVKLVTTKKTSYTDTTAESGKLYYYTVRAFHMEDGVKSWSKYDKNGVSGAYLTPPGKVRVKAYDGKNRISFSESPGAKRYLLYRKETGGRFRRIATLSADTRKYTDTDVKSGTTYIYRVSPRSKLEGKKVKGLGTLSSEVLAYKTPLSPKLTTIYESVSDGSNAPFVTLWFLGNGSDDYTVYRREKGKAAWKKIKTVPASDSRRQNGSRRYYSVEDRRIKKGKTYEYTVGCHRVIGTHDLNSAYGKYKAFLYIANRPLYSFLSDFKSYGSLANSKTRTYRYGSSRSQQRLLKALYKNKAVYDVSKIRKDAKKVISGGSADPFGKFTGKPYLKVNEKVMRWTAKNIFHCSNAEINKFRSPYLNNRTDGKPYIKGTYFYLRKAADKAPRTSIRILSVQYRNGFYFVKYRIANNDGSRGSKAVQCAVLKHVKIDKKLYWTLYTHNTGRFLAP